VCGGGGGANCDGQSGTVTSYSHGSSIFSPVSYHSNVASY
jgi:hypothetical protein